MGNRVTRVGKILTPQDGVSPFADSATESGTPAAGGDVEFIISDEQGDSALRLSSNSPRFGMWKQYLESRRATGTPVYVEADDETDEVSTVLPSYLYTVEVVEEAEDGDGVDIGFLQSPAVSRLPKAHPRFEELRVLLTAAAEATATLLVTCRPDDREIVDARPAPGSQPLPGVSNGPVTHADSSAFDNVPPTMPPPILPAPLTPEDFEMHVTLSEALLAFDFVASISELEIPFKYPVDCCVARAHMMSRFLQERLGISARKLWNYGSAFPGARGTIRFVTANHPSGSVSWRYHVAPVLSVRDFHARFLVLDPSMFTVRPVTIDEWLAAQNDPGARQSHSAASAFTHVPPNHQTFDDLLRSTTDQLEGHRLAWRTLRASFFTPPPLA